MLGHTAQVAREALGVGGVPDHRGVLEPVGPQHALEVAAVQAVGPLGVRRGGQPDEVGTQGGGPLGAVRAA